MRFSVALVLCAALIAGCGEDDEPAATPAASVADLTVEVDPDGRPDPRRPTVKCDAPEDCPEVDALDPKVFEPTPGNVACTQQFGGPETAKVTGTFKGEQVDAEVQPPERLRDRALGGRGAAARGGSVSWQVIVRTGPRVQKQRADSLEEALELLETETRVAANTVRRPEVDVRFRRFTPAQQVAVRAELRGPGPPRGLRRPRRRLGAGVDGPHAAPAGRAGGRRDASTRPCGGPFRAPASSRSAAASARGRASPARADSSSRQKRGEWSITSRWQTSCSTT